MPNPEQFTQTTPLGDIAVTLERHVIDTPPQFHVPYEGSDETVRRAFPHGFPPSYGSGIAFKERDGDALRFFCLTDRGPNGDGPDVPAPGTGELTGSKLFPAPSFVPSIGELLLTSAGAQLVSSVPIRSADGTLASGLPIPPGRLGNSAEIPLGDALRFDPSSKVVFHAGGIDSEAIAFDPGSGALWITDEYGPFLLRIDPASGVVRQRFGPGHGLPAILARRRANRGMEGMTRDPATGLLHAFLQSPLSDGTSFDAATGRDEKVEQRARFLRWVAFDPEQGGTARMWAYPLDPAAFAHGRTGHAKLGDVAALGNGNFIVIEQGEGADGKMFNHLLLVQTAQASDLLATAFNPDTADLERSSMAAAPVNGADWSAVTPLRKTLLLNLNRIGWVAEKAEGLALVDGHTLAMTNDNDFGMKTRMYDAGGAELAQADVTGVQVDEAGRIVAGSAASDVIRVARVVEKERALTLWLLRFTQPLASLGA